MFDFTKLWDKAYLIGPNPTELSRSDYLFFWAALTLIAAGLAAKFIAFRQEKGSPRQFLVNRFFRLFLTTGLLILLWAAARFENIPWLSARLLVLGLFLLWAVWLAFIFRYFLKKYRAQQEFWRQEAIKRKYLKQQH